MRGTIPRSLAFATLLAGGAVAQAVDFTDYEWALGDCAELRPGHLVLDTCLDSWGCDNSEASFVVPMPGTYTVDLHYEVKGAQLSTGITISAGFDFAPSCSPTPCSGDVKGIVLPVQAGEVLEFRQSLGWHSCGWDNDHVRCTFTNLNFYPEAGVHSLGGGVSLAHLFSDEVPEWGIGYVGDLAMLGDLNGDGHADWACGLPSHGVVRLFSGRDGSLLHELKGAGDVSLGLVIAAVGDTDGDGVDDLAVTDSYWPGTGWEDALGRVLLFSGATGVELWSVSGTQVLGGFGQAIAGPGDVDGDGVNDLVVGAYEEDGPAGDEAGCVRVFSGATQALLFEAYGDVQHGRLGAVVAGVGDVNGDGSADFAATMPGYATENPAGTVRVWSGTGAVLHTFTGVPQVEPLVAVAAAGDTNSDGFPDVLTSAPWGKQPAAGIHGIVRVRSGPTGASVLWVAGTQKNEAFGSSIAAAGDLDGNGFDDVLVGSPGWQKNHGRVQAISGATGKALFDIAPDLGLQLGNMLDGGRDLDADGIPDVLITAGLSRVMGYSGAPAKHVEPRLDVQGSLVGGSVLSFFIVDAPPGGTAFVVAGASVAQLPFKGGLLVPTPERIVAVLKLQPDGSAGLQTSWPAALVAPDVVIVQAWMPTAESAQGFVGTDALVLAPP